MSYGAACGGDVRHILGEIGECKIVEIEEAAVWARGDGDVLAKTGHPQSGVIAQIVDILVTDEEEAEPT